MNTNNHQTIDYSAVLEKEFGKHGTPERAQFDEEALLSIQVIPKQKKRNHKKNQSSTIFSFI